MIFLLRPWQLLLVFLASWINRQQAEVIDYLRTENQVLKEKLGPRRICLTDDQRRRLAVKGHILGRKRLEEVGTLFTPDTILRWHRMLVAQKWNYSAKRNKTGRPKIDTRIVELIAQMARENPSWGYDRIQGALANLGHQVSDQTIGNVLQDENIQPLRLPPQSPNLNAHLERFLSSLRSECLDRMIFFGEQSLRTAVREYLRHYAGERNHQGLGNKILQPEPDLANATAPSSAASGWAGSSAITIAELPSSSALS